ncbi:MAG: NeuD/PglB/VioB family sugar acetyltransferase [Synergistaceae bacterium]|jgi:sugar O-acyltransferase (sialic acid O-acetyltransferase NeuD family)|nr:NeuD/PglB/VioB family sugar acetyltransferase [Synergistaceae bacterium]
MDLVIYGAGGLGRETEALLHEVDPDGRKWNFLGFIDDARPAGSPAGKSKVLGSAAWLASRTEPVAVVFGFCDPLARAVVFEKLSSLPHVTFPVLIHPLAWVADSAALGEGTVISAYSLVSVDTRLGRCVFINVGCQVGHDAVLGDFCAVMPHVDISGNVTMGEKTLVGVGAKILQGLSIGPEAVVGIGSIVLSNVPDGCTVIGNPARVVKKPAR